MTMAGTHHIGWIGLGRMGEPMAAYLINAGNRVSVWNRTKAKAEPLAKLGATLVDTPAALAGCDVVFLMVSTGKDVEQVCFGRDGVASGGKGKTPKIFVDCSSISAEESAACRAKLAELGADLIAAPVSGNAKVVRAGKLSAVASGPRAAFDAVAPYIRAFAPRGVSYVGEGELSRFCKIAHNVMLGVVIQNLAEIVILAEKAGVPRHA
ncbi:MAG TPA: NAD(P)-dependent oxidoreductase, partial [Hyphomicrobiaceae bacterium]